MKFKIKNSVILISGKPSDDMESAFGTLIKSFDMANATPNDAFSFVRSLKKLLR